MHLQAVRLAELAQDLFAPSFDIANRYGLSDTTSLTFGQLLWYISAAHQKAKDAWKATTYNTNITYNNAAAIGVSYAENNFDARDEKAKSYLIYTSYTMPIMDFKNAEVTFSLSYSDTKNAFGVKDKDEKTNAFRTRFNYYF